MDLEIRHGFTNGEERIFFDMDKDTAWALAQVVGDLMGIAEAELAEVYEEIYGGAE